MPVQVKSPYNFVPLNNKVFVPDWAKFVSHDIPFQNSLSGKIKLKITAQTPIFIRGKKEANSLTNNIGGTDIYQYRFFKHNDKYCIPGTSIKGELASVMEVMGFGKLRFDNKKSTDRFNVRDMTNRQNLVGQATGCGFLVCKDGKYKIEDCGQVVKISHKEIKDKLNLIKSAKDKYDLSKLTKLVPVTVNSKYIGEQHGTIKIEEIDNESTTEGQLVFTNHIEGKEHEFIFIRNKDEICIDNNIVNDFKEVYFNGESELGNFWKNDFNKKKPIPIFYQVQERNIKIGFTQLFKLAYKNSIYNLIENNFPNLLSDKYDLVDTIFGYTDGQNNEKLKGRVSIEPATITSKPEEMKIVTTNLGTPKPTFYPYYIFQNPDTTNNKYAMGNKKYKTFMHDDAILSGRKRYPVKEEILGKINENVSKTTVKNDEDISKTTVSFFPLKEGAKFETTIHYHNLRPVELGALLSALTFHNTTACHHSLGMAKPLGYGNVKFEIDFDKSDIKEKKSLELMCRFEKLMSSFETNWLTSEQLEELFTMAKPLPADHEKFNDLTYLELSEFQEIKKTIKESKEDCKERLGRECTNNERKIIQLPQALPRYSKFTGNDFTITPESLSEKCEGETNDFEINISNELDSIFQNKKKSLVKKIESEIQNIEQDIIHEKKKKEEEATKKIADLKANAEKKEKEDRDIFRKEEGINMLLEQVKMKKLLKKTREWMVKYYCLEERRRINWNIQNTIPEKHLKEFMEHIQSIFENDEESREWKNKKEKGNNYKYLIHCIGEDEANKWFNNNTIKIN